MKELVRHGEVVAPAGYFLLTAAEKAELCNGAGPKKIGWLVPDTIYGVSITESANVHDYMYADPAFSREFCDKVFLENMLHQINAHDGWKVIQQLRRARAHTYYYSVRAFGGLFRKGVKG